MVGTVRGGGQNLSRPQHKTIINYRIIGGSIEANHCGGEIALVLSGEEWVEID